MAESYQLKWHSHNAYLYSNVSALQRSQMFTDVTLCTIDGKCLLAHRFILSACSPYFDKILQHSYNFSRSVPVYIMLPPEISTRSMTILLQYMYSGEATVANTQLSNVLKAGEILKVRGLFQEPDSTPRASKMVTYPHQPQVPLTSPPETGILLHVKDKTRSGSFRREQRDTCRAIRPKPLQSEKPVMTPTCFTKTQAAPSNSMADKKPTESVKIEPLDEEQVTKVIQDGPETQLIVKNEPLQWDDSGSDAETHMTIQPEISYASDEPDDTESTFYAPLTCDFCQETFNTPALWVRHTQSHEIVSPSSKRRKQDSDDKGDPSVETSLRCELCQEVYQSPAEWVRHIQNTHTDEQLATSNYMEESNMSFSTTRRRMLNGRQQCPLCEKTFPSHASMMIHTRTHTGEKPYHCHICEKGFNVKSNLLRHMRTLHDSAISPLLVKT